MKINTIRSHRIVIQQSAVWTRLAALLGWLMMVRAYILPMWVMWQRRIQAAWRALQGRDAYHGARLLPNEDSIPWQWRIAKALGSADRALIVIKFHQWIEYNRREGRAATTYYGYDEWVANHFGHLNDASLGRHVRALEQMGVLKTQRVGRRDQRKSYRIDYGRLNALIAKVKMGISAVDVTKSDPQTRKSKTQGADSNLNHDSNRGTQSTKPNAVKPNAETQAKPTKPVGRGGRRAGAGRKKKEAVTDAPVAAAATNSSTAATRLEAGMQAAQTPNPSPSSAEPPSHPEAALIERMADLGLDVDKAAVLIDEHGADRVRAVVRKCEQRLKPDSREQCIENPSGWIIAELRNDVFKLGTLTADEEWNLPENLWRRLAAQSMTGDELEESDAGALPEIPAVTASEAPDDYQNHGAEGDETPAIPAPENLAKVLWDRAMGELDQFCLGETAQQIHRHVTLLDYDGAEALFCVQADDANTFRLLQQNAGTIKAILTRLNKRPCRIKHVDRPGQEWRH